MNNEQASAIHLLLFDSSSSSESSDHEFRGPMEGRPRVLNYVEEVVDNYNEEEFRQNFRLTRPTFDHLLSLIKGEVERDKITVGRHTIDAKVQLLLALWYFGTPDSYRSVSSRFGKGRATALRAVRRVTLALLHLASSVIKWPTERGDHQEVIAGFDNQGFPDTIGAVDGSYIPIPKPKDNGRSYICRKNFAALNLTAVVDHQRRFTFAYAGEVGSTHDAEVLRRSELWNFFHQPEKFPNNSHVIGDKAYPLIPQLMTPFRDNGHLGANQLNYNYRLSRARSTVERAFGLLKGRWRCLLDLFATRNLEWAPRYIVAICVLHNICLMRNDIMDVNMPALNEYDDEEDAFIDDRALQEQRRLAQIKRNYICEHL